MLNFKVCFPVFYLNFESGYIRVLVLVFLVCHNFFNLFFFIFRKSLQTLTLNLKKFNLKKSKLFEITHSSEHSFRYIHKLSKGLNRYILIYLFIFHYLGYKTSMLCTYTIAIVQHTLNCQK
jgi:hypothetical protein